MQHRYMQVGAMAELITPLLDIEADTTATTTTSEQIPPRAAWLLAISATPQFPPR
jgi:hypothetical protein